MKKLIIICLLAFTYNITNAQEPTKQDAMDFIAKKMKQHLKPECNSLNFTDGIITIRLDHFIGKEVKNRIYLKNITSRQMWYVKGPKIFSYYSLSAYNEESDVYQNEISLCEYADLDHEDGLIKRIEKALDVIIKSNNYDPDSKF